MSSSYPPLAQALVDRMVEAATADPSRAVAFQGAPGAYSHQAVREAFPDRLPLPCAGFEDAIEAVQAGRAGVAMIPIENSQHGRVADIHFLLPESGLAIVGEHFVRVRHCLLGLADKAALREVKSHPQALGQVRRHLRAHHASSEHGDFFPLKSGHGFFLIYCVRTQVWVRPKGPKEPRTSGFWPPWMGVMRRV